MTLKLILLGLISLSNGFLHLSYIYLLPARINPSLGRGQPLGSFFSSCFCYQCHLSSIGEASCLVPPHRFFCGPPLRRSLTSAVNSFNGVFVFSPYHII